MTSLPVLAARGFPPFHVFAMLGGVLWCSGNMMCGPIIQVNLPIHDDCLTSPTSSLEWEWAY